MALAFVSRAIAISFSILRNTGISELSSVLSNITSAADRYIAFGSTAVFTATVSIFMSFAVFIILTAISPLFAISILLIFIISILISKLYKLLLVASCLFVK